MRPEDPLWAKSAGLYHTPEDWSTEQLSPDWLRAAIVEHFEGPPQLALLGILTRALLQRTDYEVLDNKYEELKEAVDALSAAARYEKGTGPTSTQAEAGACSLCGRS